MELGLILLIVILVFGAGKLPELGGALGKTLKEFKSATREMEDVKDSVQETVKESVSLESPKRDGVAAKSDSPEKKVAS